MTVEVDTTTVEVVDGSVAVSVYVSQVALTVQETAPCTVTIQQVPVTVAVASVAVPIVATVEAVSTVELGVQGPQGPKGDPGTGGTTFYQEVPAGVIDGSNRNFVLSAVPLQVTSLLVFLNGLAQRNGGDYTLVGSQTVQMINAPQVGDSLLAYYAR